MKFFLEKNNCDRYHNVREHSNVEKDCGGQMKNDNANVCEVYSTPVKKKKANYEIITATEPTKQISYPFFLHEPANYWIVRKSGKPDL